MYSPSYGGRLLSRRGRSNVTWKCPPPDDLQSMMRSDAVSAETIIPRQCEGAKTPILCPCRSTEITGACPTGLRLLWSPDKTVSDHHRAAVSWAILGLTGKTMISSKTKSNDRSKSVFSISNSLFSLLKIYKIH